VAVRYRANGFAASEDAAFFLLLDLMTFFDLFHSKKIDEALDIISKIKVNYYEKLNKNETQTLVYRLVGINLMMLNPSLFQSSLKFANVKCQLVEITK
jgi:hypothetical protein